MSEHFPSFEWRCHDGTPVPPELVPNAEALASQLEIVRAEAGGVPLEIVSWYRTPAHNAAVGGAQQSQHMRAAAADVRPYFFRDGQRIRWEFLTPVEQVATIRRLSDDVDRLLLAQRLPLIGGRGYYPGKWLHLDVRPRPADGHIATWMGTGVGSEK